MLHTQLPVSPVEVVRKAGQRQVRKTGKYLLAGGFSWLTGTVSFWPSRALLYRPSGPLLPNATNSSYPAAWIVQQLLFTVGAFLITLGTFHLAKWFLPTRSRIFTNFSFLTSLLSSISWLMVAGLLFWASLLSRQQREFYLIASLFSGCRKSAAAAGSVTCLLTGLAFLRTHTPRLMGWVMMLSGLLLLMLLITNFPFHPFFIYLPFLLLGIYLQTRWAQAEKAY